VTFEPKIPSEMKAILTLLTVLSLVLGTGVWAALLSWTPETIAALGEMPSAVFYFGTIFALFAGGAVCAFGDRCIQFLGAVACVVALLGLAAFHSTHTHDDLEPAVATSPPTAVGD
jgi:hypothetical protein